MSGVFFTKKEIDFMKAVIKIAKKGLYTTSPNPMVGAIITDGENIISKGYHKFAGGPHAEIEALKRIKGIKKSLNLYVNLEPCCHFGRTGPCVEEIIKSPIKKVYISTKDPNPQVNGKSIEKLKENGIEVELGLLEKEAIILNRRFFYNQKYKMPYVILKAALTLDGYIADKKFKSKWITSEFLRKEGKKIREEVDGILVGINTVLKDNPFLDRMKEHPPRSQIKKIILDPEGKMDLNFNLTKKGEIIWVLKEGIKRKPLSNIKIINLPVIKGSFPLKELLKKLYDMGVYSILIEGGGQTSGHFLREKLVQEVALFFSYKILGNGIKVFKGVNFNLNEALNLEDLCFKKTKSGFYLRGIICSLESLKP